MRFHQYLKGNQLGNGLGKEKLLLKVAQCSNQHFENLKVPNDTMAKTPRIAKFCNHVLYMEGEEMFGSQKHKLDMPLGDKQKSHKPNQVNFTCLQVEIRSSRAQGASCSLANI